MRFLLGYNFFFKFVSCDGASGRLFAALVEYVTRVSLPSS